MLAHRDLKQSGIEGASAVRLGAWVRGEGNVGGHVASYESPPFEATGRIGHVAGDVGYVAGYEPLSCKGTSQGGRAVGEGGAACSTCSIDAPPSGCCSISYRG